MATRPLRRRVRSFALPSIIGLLVQSLSRCSWRRAQRFGPVIGRLAWRWSRRDRERTLAHLEMAFPELDPRYRLWLAKASFAHLGTNIAEILHLLGRPVGEACKHFDVEGVEIFAQLREAGRPALVLTGHCGNWEMIPSLRYSHDVTIRALARGHDDPSLRDIIERLRDHLGTVNLPRGSRRASREMLRALRQGGVIGVLIDQDIATDGVWVPFFDHPAHTTTAPATLALKLGAAVVPVFDERLLDGRHRVVVHPVMDLPDDPVAATAAMTEVVEAQIRRAPEQWVWLHRRWRRQQA
ncbi:MAG: lysophospholipid acyltransferase family protein [Acidobacteriota bacterium]